MEGKPADELEALRRRLAALESEVEALRRRLAQVESSRGYRLLQGVRRLLRTVAPPGSLRWRLLTAPLDVRLPSLSLPRPPVERGPGEEGPVRRLRLGCYGEYAWTVGGGAVHVLQFLQALAPYYRVDLLLPPEAPLRSPRWFRQQLGIELEGIRVLHYRPGMEADYDIWVSACNDDIRPAPTPRRYNIVFFPFVPLDGRGFVHIANSRYTAEHVRQRYGTDDVAVIYPPVDNGAIRPGQKEPLVLHVSRFALPSPRADKGHLAMVQAFKDLCRRGLEGWRLVLAGSTVDAVEEAYARLLQREAAGYPIEVRANPGRQELLDLYARAAIYWHATGLTVKDPAAQEHFGITVLEAMAAGAVPVVYASGGPAETVVHAESGYLFESLDGLVELTLRLARDEGERRRLAEGARRRAEEFGLQRFQREVAALVSGSGKVSIVLLAPSDGHRLEALERWTPPGYESLRATGGGPGADDLRAALRESDPTRPYVLYLRPWAEALPGWLEPLVDLLEREPSVGAVSPLLLCPDGKLLEGVTFGDDALPRPRLGLAGSPQVPVTVEALFPACLLVRRDWALLQGGAGPWAEICLGLRLRRAGLALAVHRGSVVRLNLEPRPPHELWPEGLEPFRREWGDGLPGDDGEAGLPIWRAGDVAVWPRTPRLKMA